jgi:hypothetical protein
VTFQNGPVTPIETITFLFLGWVEALLVLYLQMGLMYGAQMTDESMEHRWDYISPRKTEILA